MHQQLDGTGAYYVKNAAQVREALEQSGKVIAVNETLESTPEVVNESAEESGWICVLDMSDPAEVQNLMPRAQYDEFLKTL